MAFDLISFSSISEVKSKYQMIIPEYQRGYSWGISQWNALWDDAIAIDNFPNTQREHFAGSIMISSGNPDENGIIKVDLIDGQQRWTTIALMLKALGDEAYPIKYKENEALQNYFDYYALGVNQLSTRLVEHRNFYTRNLEEAAKFFSNKAGELDFEKRCSLINIIKNRFKIFTLSIQPTFDVHVAFETINSRGKPLSTLEKLKNRLIYLAANSEDNNAGKNAIDTIHRCWKSVYGWLGHGPELLSDDEFLRAHALGWFRHEKRADWLSTQLFYDEFSSQSQIKPDYIEKYVHSLEKAALWWYRLSDPRDNLPRSICKGLNSLERTPSATTKPLLLWALIRLEKDYQTMVMDSSTDGPWVKSFEGLLKQAERFSVLVILANNRQANVGQTDINRSAYALAHPNTPIYEKGKIPPEGAADAIFFASQHLEALVKNQTNSSDGELTYQQFNFNGFFNESGVRDVISDRIRSGNGFYKWQLGKLMIYLWEEKLQGAKGLPEKKSWEKISWDDSVEHIYPQNPHNSWSNSIHFHGNKSKSVSSAVSNSIGNLLLLSINRNAENSNDPFIPESGKKGKSYRYIKGCYSENQVALICKQWTIIQIAARGIAIWRLAQKVWDFKLVEDNAKLTNWMPYLFGDQWEVITKGATVDKKPITHKSLKVWLDKFEQQN